MENTIDDIIKVEEDLINKGYTVHKVIKITDKIFLVDGKFYQFRGEPNINDIYDVLNDDNGDTFVVKEFDENEVKEYRSSINYQNLKFKKGKPCLVYKEIMD